MKIIAICNTKYQLMSCIDTVGNFFCNDEVDLFIKETIDDIEAIITKVKKFNIFRNIILYKCRYHSEMNRLYYRLIYYIAPKKYLEKTAGIKKNVQYDALLTSTACGSTYPVICSYPKIDVLYYDDGLASYIDRYSLNFISDYDNKRFGFLKQDMSALTAHKLYVFLPEMCKKRSGVEYLKLPSFSDPNNRLQISIENLFSYSETDTYKDSQIVYLSQYNSSLAYVDDAIDDVFKKHRNNLIIRKHPVQDTERFDKGFKIDKSNNIWELICKNEIDECNILISISSTSITIPKMFYDKEPYLIILIDLYREIFSSELYDSLHEFFNRLRNSYRNPERVVFPQSTDEIDYYIEKFNHRT